MTQGLSFTVGKGECFGLLGVNGAGKTTTFRILTGELLPHCGNAYIQNVSLLQATSKFRSFLGYCPEKDGLLDMMTGTETLVLFGRLRGVSMTAEYLREMLDIFRLAEFADNLVGTYRRIVDYMSALQKITNLSIVLTSHRTPAYQSKVINGVYRLFPKADMAHAYEVSPNK
ncbi:hypothetical protein HPB48_017661 [Haemaphysalis longicornis]|uniref:ABC transporter domain-containing protein n=1 Tax=Haemaphysalis longicornis TaxID=44386 RepID=A0A9J6GK45_HAELO|nr:hypothetical protein HPB48_017661 [Haemaphysalis longicornis]